MSEFHLHTVRLYTDSHPKDLDVDQGSLAHWSLPSMSVMGFPNQSVHQAY